jgi:hypothetical protein
MPESIFIQFFAQLLAENDEIFFGDTEVVAAFQAHGHPSMDRGPGTSARFLAPRSRFYAGIG